MSPFQSTPWLHNTWELPGVMSEGGALPGMTASAIGAPLPSSGDFGISGNPGGYPEQPPLAQQPSEQPMQLPDHMAGINRALAQNQELGDIKPKNGIGEFLLAWAGHLGDALTETPAYAKAAEKGREAQKNREQQMMLRHALINNGVPASQVALYMANPEAIGSQFATRLQTRTVDEGSSVYTPNPGGGANVFTAPKTFNEGADVIQSPALNTTLGPPPLRPGTLQTPHSPLRIGGLRPEAQQYADMIAPTGSKDWRSAISDYVLKANGPTANAHDRDIWGQRLDVTRRGQDVTRRGQDIGSRDRRRGQDVTDRRVRGSASYQGRGGKGGAPKRSDLIGPVYRKGGRQIQYSKGAGGYVDVETGRRVQ